MSHYLFLLCSSRSMRTLRKPWKSSSESKWCHKQIFHRWSTDEICYWPGKPRQEWQSWGIDHAIWNPVFRSCSKFLSALMLYALLSGIIRVQHVQLSNQNRFIGKKMQWLFVSLQSSTVNFLSIFITSWRSSRCVQLTIVPVKYPFETLKNPPVSIVS